MVANHQGGRHQGGITCGGSFGPGCVKTLVKTCPRWRQLFSKAAIAVPFPRSRECYSLVKTGGEQ
jgi:hypothetical protein